METYGISETDINAKSGIVKAENEARERRKMEQMIEVPLIKDGDQDSAGVITS